MIEQAEAEKTILDYLNSPDKLSGRGGDLFVISAIKLSENNDYWILNANNKRYVEEGEFSKCYVGVMAYLLDRRTGQVEIIGSAQSVEDYLQDKYDEREANGAYYALASSDDPLEKKAVIKLHQVFNCSLTDAKELMAGTKRIWAIGKKRSLHQAVAMLNEKGISAEVKLVANKKGLPEMPDHLSFWNELIEVIYARIAA